MKQSPVVGDFDMRWTEGYDEGLRYVFQVARGMGLDLTSFARRYWIRLPDGACLSNVADEREVHPYIQNARRGVTTFQKGGLHGLVYKDEGFWAYLESDRSAAELESFLNGFLAGLAVRRPEPPPADEDEAVALVGDDLRQAYAVVPIDAQDTLVVADDGMRQAVRYIERSVVANPTAPVLIVGETGTGKEVLAKLIARRAGRRLIPVLISGLPPEVVPVHLFGARAGSFTGAVDRPGVMAAAGDGIVFLDEIGDLPAEYQSVLLRAVDRGEVQRLGEDEPVRVRCRFIAATSAERLSRLRPDLLYRLMHFYIECPPLRERPADVVAITHYVLTHRLGRTADAGFYEFLLGCRFPGNVRQLIHFLRAVAETVPAEATVTVSSLRHPFLRKQVESLGCD